MPILTLPTPAAVTPAFRWVAPDGVQTSLTDPPLAVLLGAIGLHMPPATFVTESVPLNNRGEHLRFPKTSGRVIDLPLFMEVNDPASLAVLLRTLEYQFDPTRGDSILQAQAADGQVRQLTCRYQSGLEGDERMEVSTPTSREVVLVLHAFDPFWYSASPLVTTFTQSSAAPFFPFFPLQLGSSNVLADATVSNPGDLEAWPIWTINGPLTQVTLTHQSTGADDPTQALTLNTALSVGDVVTIDTRPGQKTVLGPGGVNLYGSLAAGSRLWALPRGSSTVHVGVNGATGSTSVILTVTPRFLGM